jgi:hypothetical protein
MMVADPPPVYMLSVRPPQTKRGGPVSPYRLFQPGAPNATFSPAALAAFHHLLVMIHGFNDDLPFAIQVYGQMFQNLANAKLFSGSGAPDVIIHFHWPGDVAVVGPLPFLDFLGYATDLEQCIKASALLAGFFSELSASTGTVRTISVITHSMGGRVLLEALKNSSSASEFKVVALMAAAVPTDIAQQGRTLAATDAPPHQIRKYRSSTDTVLSLAFPMGQLLAWAESIESAAYGEAIGTYGEPASYGTDLGDQRLGHSQYWPSAAIANDIAAAINPVCRTSTAPARQLPQRKLSPAWTR